MSSLNKNSFFKNIIFIFSNLILFLSVFNEFDFNYLKIEYFSFNFVHILIFFWTLKNPNHLGYISIFLAGIINDVIIGIPIGVSSFCYLLICSVQLILEI
jgi:rod shape-determining protein MreD